MIETKDKRDIYGRLATYRHDCFDLLEKAIILIYEGVTEERLINLKRGTQALMNHCEFCCSKIKPDNEQPAENNDEQPKSRFQQ